MLTVSVQPIWTVVMLTFDKISVVMLIVFLLSVVLLSWVSWRHTGLFAKWRRKCIFWSSDDHLTIIMWSYYNFQMITLLLSYDLRIILFLPYAHLGKPLQLIIHLGHLKCIKINMISSMTRNMLLKTLEISFVNTYPSICLNTIQRYCDICISVFISIL
jgi:hypothetical protein